MIPEEKLDRFISTISQFRKQLNRNNSIAVHKHVNESYYLQKEAELNILKEQRDEARTRLDSVQSRISHHYEEIYFNWRKDARWLNQHMMTQARTVNLWE